MTDPRFTKLARLLVEYSTRLTRGERVLVDATDIPDEFTVELLRAIRRAKAVPLVEVRHTRITRELLRDTDDTHSGLLHDIEMFRMKKVQAYMAIRGSSNANENADVPSDRMALYSKTMRPVLNYRVNKTKWVVLRWPTPSMAQAAGKVWPCPMTGAMSATNTRSAAHAPGMPTRDVCAARGREVIRG